MESNSHPLTPKELTSWKDVAAYLRVSVRTAQKWEADRGLPVTRLPGQGRSRITVKVADLERWKMSAAPVADVRKPKILGNWQMWAMGAVVILAAAAVASWRLSQNFPAVHSFRIDQGDFVACDRKGKELWRASFNGLSADFYASRWPTRQVFWTGDLDGKAGEEVLFLKAAADEHEKGYLVCFSQDGNERWRFQPRGSVATRKETFSDNFAPANFLVVPWGNGGSPAIVVASNHVPYYPSQVALLSAQGAVMGEHWHSGSLYLMAVKGSRVYLGGISNGHRAATAIALDRENFSGASVESNPDYQLLGFPPAREAGRIIFPRTCISRKFEEYNFAASLSVAETDILAIVTERHPPSAASILFHLTPDLELIRAEFTDVFRSTHADLRAAGQLDHDLTAGEEAVLRNVTKLTGLGR